jgi:hypothetical protein
MQDDPGFLSERFCVCHTSLGASVLLELVPVKTAIAENTAQFVQASEQPDSPACDKKPLKVPPAVHLE